MTNHDTFCPVIIGFKKPKRRKPDEAYQIVPCQCELIRRVRDDAKLWYSYKEKEGYERGREDGRKEMRNIVLKAMGFSRIPMADPYDLH
jgi:hypothetical protein